MSAPIVKPAAYGSLFRVGELRAIFLAHLASVLGDVVASVALAVLVYDRTKSAALSAATFSIAFVPYLFGGALVSSLADRVRPRRVLVTCNLLSAALVAVMILPSASIPVLFTLIFFVSVLASVTQSSRFIALPGILVEQPLHILGRSLIRIVAQAGQIAGYAAGGLLVVAFSPRGALIADAASFGISAIVLRFGMKDRATGSGQARANSGAIFRRPTVKLPCVTGARRLRRTLLFSWLLSACLIAPEALAVPYLAEIGRPTGTAGYLLAVL